MSPASVPEFLKALRLQRELTQTELASRAGMSNTTVSGIELGDHRPHRGTTGRLLDVLRAQKELSRSEMSFAKKNLNLPDDYLWDVPNTKRPLTWEFIDDHSDQGLQPWITHCVRELTLQLGQEAMLDLILTTARAKGLSIPEVPSV